MSDQSKGQVSPIFVSYRIKDTLPTADRLAADLERAFGQDQVFFDRRTIEPGETWDDRIEAAVKEAKVVLVLIGKQWLTVQDDYGRRRIDMETDWVRREVEEALKIEGRVVPVLVDDASPVPAAALVDLPDMAKLASCQAAKLRIQDWDSDFNTLLTFMTFKGLTVLAQDDSAQTIATRRPAPTIPVDSSKVNGTRILCICSPSYLQGLIGNITDFQAMKQKMDSICNVFSADGSFTEAPGVDSSQFADVLSTGKYDIVQAGPYVHPLSGRVFFADYDESVLCDEEEIEDSISAEAFATLIKRSSARLVLLLACDSLALASRLSRFTNVIAASRTVGIPTIIAWEKALYQCLGRGDTLSMAVDTANALKEQSMMLLLHSELSFEPKSTRGSGVEQT